MKSAAICLFVVLGIASEAGAQSSLPLLLEVAREPQSADGPLTARTLALGGARGTTGGAEDALTNPSGLTRGKGHDVVVSLGRVSFGRDELTLTPRQLPPFQPERTPSATSTAPGFFGAAAFRRANLAGAAFVDSSSRMSHRFTTAENSLRVSAIQGIILDTRASGTAAMDTTLTRIGGAFAAASPGGRVSVGGAFFLGHFDALIESVLDVDDSAQFYAPYPPSITHNYSQQKDVVAFDHWSSGFVVSAAVQVAPPVTLSARWEHTRPFTSARRHSDTSSSAAVPEEPVEWRPPPVFGVALTASARRTLFIIELTRTAYEEVYGPTPEPIADSSSCQTLATSRCEGWGFGPYLAANSTGLRMGIEQGVPAGRSVIHLRGGFSIAEAYSLARPADDPAIFALSLPKPPIPTLFTPPRETPWSWSIGSGVTIGRVEIGAGLAFGPQQRRILVDLRVIR